jgi:hypothetical protein
MAGEAAIIFPTHVDPDLCEPVMRIGRREFPVKGMSPSFRAEDNKVDKSLIVKI